VGCNRNKMFNDLARSRMQPGEMSPAQHFAMPDRTKLIYHDN